VKEYDLIIIGTGSGMNYIGSIMDAVNGYHMILRLESGLV